MKEIKDKITETLKVAMKAQDKLTMSVLRMILSEMTLLEKSGKEFKYIDAVKGYAKKLKKTIEEYERLKLPDKANEVKAELAIVEEYLPKPMGDDELERIVAEVIEANKFTSKDIGNAMKIIMGKYSDVVDGKRVQSLIREKLSK
ncbi:MAG TPA: GatB/YqeY domain-containing protein [Candidatus Brocadiia bacterium]|nr:GatB/YqeY domain-containing protein [Candidatus Brocadiales bacterium]